MVDGLRVSVFLVTDVFLALPLDSFLGDAFLGEIGVDGSSVLTVIGTEYFREVGAIEALDSVFSVFLVGDAGPS